MSHRERDREREELAGGATVGAAGGSGGDADAVQQRTDELLAAGDRAIERALSRDSASFLKQVRQHGGQ